MPARKGNGKGGKGRGNKGKGKRRRDNNDSNKGKEDNGNGNAARTMFVPVSGASRVLKMTTSSGELFEFALRDVHAYGKDPGLVDAEGLRNEALRMHTALVHLMEDRNLRDRGFAQLKNSLVRADAALEQAQLEVRRVQ